MKTKEELKHEVTLKVDALADVCKSLENIALSEEIEFDPSLKVVMDGECTVGYGVADDDSLLVRISIGKGMNEPCVVMDRDSALSLAANIIAFAMHLCDMNDACE